MNTYIATLTDHGALGEPIVWRTTSIAEARELLANVGSWQSAPDSGDAILLGSGAYVTIYDDTLPPATTPTLDNFGIVDGVTPRVIFDLGPRGGIRRISVA